MENGTKTLVDSGLNTLMMIAFAVPEGAPFGIALAGLTFLFDAIFPPLPLPNPPVTTSQLREALNGLKEELIDAIWNSGADKINYQVLAFKKGLDDTLSMIGKVQMDGERYILSETNDTIGDFVANTYSYFDTEDTDGLLNTLKTMRNTLELRSLNDDDDSVKLHRAKTLGLYGLIGTLIVSYLKAAASWKWGRELLAAWQYRQYQAEVAQWKADNGTAPAGDDLAGITAKYPGVSIDPHFKPLDLNGWMRQPLCPGPLLAKEVQEMLKYWVNTPGLYTEWSNGLNDSENRATDGDAGLNPGAVTQADLQKSVDQGAHRAGWLAVLGTKYMQTEAGEDDLASFKNAIEAWRSTASPYDFTQYTVRKDDTLRSIGTKLVPAVAAQILHDTNPGISYTNPGVAVQILAPVPGTILRIYK